MYCRTFHVHDAPVGLEAQGSAVLYHYYGRVGLTPRLVTIIPPQCRIFIRINYLLHDTMILISLECHNMIIDIQSESEARFFVRVPTPGPTEVQRRSPRCTCP